MCETAYASTMAVTAGAGHTATPGRVAWFLPKLTRPTIRAGTVDRHRLVDRLCSAEATQVVIAAPGGYGKSTLAALWADRDDRSFCWITLDDADNDPVVFLTYVVLALDSISPLDSALVEQLTTTSTPWPHMLPRVLDAVTSIADPFVLVVDDAHRLRSSSATEVLAALAGRIPPGSTLACLTRGTMPYPTSRGLLSGHVLRLGVSDLAMDATEATALLVAAGIEPDPLESDALLDQTEGWPAGLYMSALALGNADGSEPAVRRFTGGDPLVTDYFTEEILHEASADDVDFLLSTAILGRLSGALCDHALGALGSGTTLARLARENHFVIPLDHEGEWYRYHHLFAEMLRTEARARRPDAVRDVARRASDWFDARAEPEPAVEHALAADDDLAPALIWRYSSTMLATSRVDTVAQWIGWYTREDVERVPALALTSAWQALVVGDMGTVHRLCAALEAKRDDLLPTGTPVSAFLAILHALTRTDGLTRMRDNAAQAYAELPPDSPYRAIACFLEGTASTYLGDLASARARLHEAIRLGRAALPAQHAQALSQLARVELAEGNTHLANRLVDEAVRVTDANQIADRPPACVCFAIASVVHLRRGEWDLGNRERALGMDLLERAEDLSPYQLLASRLDFAHAAVLAHDHGVARDMLDDADRRLAWMPETGTLGAAAGEIRALLDAASSTTDRLVEPLSRAELRVAAYLPTHLSFAEIGEVLCVSRNTVKSHAMAIYRKLGVTSRSDAVVEARRFGLIGDDPATVGP